MGESQGSGVRSAVRARLSRHGWLYGAAATSEMLVKHVRRRPHEDDFRVFRHLTDVSVFIDAGANHGQSALSISAVSRPQHRIVSFDANRANERYLRWVRRLLGSRYAYHVVGLGDHEDELDFFIPVQGSRRISGEASFDRRNVEEAASRIEGDYEIEVERFHIRTLDSYGLPADVVKIDVQGYEAQVLRGAAVLLADREPLLMIEANDATDDTVLDIVGPLGYRRYVRRASDDRLTPAGDADDPLNWFYATDGWRAGHADLFA